MGDDNGDDIEEIDAIILRSLPSQQLKEIHVDAPSLLVPVSPPGNLKWFPGPPPPADEIANKRFYRTKDGFAYLPRAGQYQLFNDAAAKADYLQLTVTEAEALAWMVSQGMSLSNDTGFAVPQAPKVTAAIGVGAAVHIPANAERQGLWLQNESPGAHVIRLGWGGFPAEVGKGGKLGPDEGREWDKKANVFLPGTGTVSMLSSLAGGIVAYQEY